MHAYIKIVPTAAAVLLAAGCQSSSSPTNNTQVSRSPANANSSAKTVSLDDAMSPAQDPTAFPADRTAKLWVKGLACPYCVTNIDRQLAGMPGVDRVHVNLPTGEVRVALAVTHPATQKQLTKAIADSGFTLDRIEMPR